MDRCETKNQLVQTKFCISMSDVKMLFGSPAHSVLLNTLLGLILLPVNSFPWQVSYSSGVPNILGSPRQYSLNLHSFTQWPLWASMQGHPCHIWPLSLVRAGDSITPFFYLDSKAWTTWLKLPSPIACCGWNMSLMFNCIFTSLFSVIYSL